MAEHVPIAIVGMHRSGTSMVTRALHDSGLRLLADGEDAFIEAAEDNPEGFWEHKAVVACNDDLLEATGGAWDNPPELGPQGADDPRVAHVVDAASAALEGLRAHPKWGFKDPRTCLTAAFWLDLEPRLRFIVCLRHPLEVALSLKRRNQNSYSLGLSLWERYYTTVLDIVPPERRIVTHYDSFFTHPDAELRRLCEFAGLDPAEAFVRPDLRHHTVGVSLGEADASPGLRHLYAELCREAGVALPPDPPTDEGRVRRLVLDGVVAARHADQRQAAIERLHEREAAIREEHRAREQELREREQGVRDELAAQRGRAQALEARIRDLEAAHRDRVRDLETTQRERVHGLEVQVAAARAEAEAAKTLNGTALEELLAAAGRAEAQLATIEEQSRAAANYGAVMVQGGPTERSMRRRAHRWRQRAHRVVAPARRLLGRGTRAGVGAASQHLPAPAVAGIRRARAVARNPRSEAPGAARAVIRRLPPRAQAAVRQGREAALDARQAATPRARAAARRLPPPVQDALRRARTAVGPGARTSVSAPPAPLPAEPAAPRPKAPKGPALRQWKAGYEELVAAAVPAGAPWLVALPGSPAEVQLPGATPYPAVDGKPLGDDLAHVARLEALRYAGHDLLVVPEGSRPWFRQRAELRDHVTGTYRCVADRDQAGSVFDLRQPADTGSRSVRAEVTGLAGGIDHAPAVLDWTSDGIADELPGVTTFRPPPGAGLPYVDASVDVVVVDADRDVAEAERVAILGVVVVGAAGDVAEVRVTSADAPAPAVRTLVWSADPDDDAAWRGALAERVAAAGAELRLAPIDGPGVASLEAGDDDVVVIVEPHVLPLPGTIEAAAALVARDPGAAVSAKVLAPDGRLESAGATVFTDRSVALVANGSPDVRAPWHDYVRPVCWSAGLTAATARLWRSAPTPDHLAGRAYVREWCSGVWATGRTVRYNPTLVAVRVAGDGGEASTPLSASSWQRVLDLRPQRPAELSDGAWRYVLARDDVEACRA